MSDAITDISSPANPTTYVKAFNRFCGTTNGTLNLKMTTTGGAVNCTAGGATQQTVASGESFDVFNGQNPQGNWTLRAYDTFTGDNGTLNSWGIEICTQAITLTSEDFTITNLAIYPNPNNGEGLNVNITGLDGQIQLELMDATGRMITQSQWNVQGSVNQSLEWNETLPVGMYHLRFRQGDLVQSVKVLVVR